MNDNEFVKATGFGYLEFCLKPRNTGSSFVGRIEEGGLTLARWQLSYPAIKHIHQNIECNLERLHRAVPSNPSSYVLIRLIFTSGPKKNERCDLTHQFASTRLMHTFVALVFLKARSAQHVSAWIRVHSATLFLRGKCREGYFNTVLQREG